MSKKDLDMSSFAKMNNILDKNTELRDVFLECERDYVAELMVKPSFKKMVRQLQKEFSADELNELANKTMIDIESGLVSPEDLDRYELMMICCLAAIVDYQKVRGEFQKLPDNTDMQ